MKKTLRIVSLLMLIVAVIFVVCALSAPNLGNSFYIGSFRVGAKHLRIFYAVYAIVMVGLFLASFFVKKGKKA